MRAFDNVCETWTPRRRLWLSPLCSVCEPYYTDLDDLRLLAAFGEAAFPAARTCIWVSQKPPCATEYQVSVGSHFCSGSLFAMLL